MTGPARLVAFVPRDGDLVCIVARHPTYAGSLCVGEQLRIGSGEDMAGAWVARDPGWCVIKRIGGIGLCRVALVAPAVCEIDAWVEATIGGVRHVGKVRRIGDYVHCDDVSGERIAAWQAKPGEVRPWVPIEGEQVQAVYGTTPITGQFMGFFGGGAQVTTADGRVYGVLRSTLSPAPVTMAGAQPAKPSEVTPWGPRAGELCTITMHGGGTATGEFDAEFDAPNEVRLRVPDSPTGFKYGPRESLRPAAPGSAGSVDSAHRETAEEGPTPNGPDNSNSTQPTEPEQPDPDPYAAHQRALDEADKDPTKYEARRQWYAAEDAACAAKNAPPPPPPPEPKRHPSDWEPPDDFEVCK